MLVAADAGIVIACLRTGRGRDCAKQRVLARAEPANGQLRTWRRKNLPLLRAPEFGLMQQGKVHDRNDFRMAVVQARLPPL